MEQRLLHTLAVQAVSQLVHVVFEEDHVGVRHFTGAFHTHHPRLEYHPVLLSLLSRYNLEKAACLAQGTIRCSKVLASRVVRYLIVHPALHIALGPSTLRERIEI